MNLAVIGSSFGDEGKGIITDYLCSQYPNPLVTRYSGGQQAGHTVERDNVRHVFSNFGSGTLLGVPTYWSKFCSADPVGIKREYQILEKLGIKPTLFIDIQTPITTPYEKAKNQLNTTNLSHGTCGVGVGQTFQREQDFYSLKAIDLCYSSIFPLKLENIRQYYYKYNEALQNEVKIFIDAVQFLKENCTLVDGMPQNYETNIFEGSQGLMLDQNIGFFPNVTRSNVGSTNILKLVDSFEPWIITRAYQTRHGNGHMTQAFHKFEQDPSLVSNIKETNVNNEFQGIFRSAILDLDLINYTVDKDEYLRNNRSKCNFVMTCLDHLKPESQCYSFNGSVRLNTNRREFIKNIMEDLNLSKIYINDSPESKTVKCIER